MMTSTAWYRRPAAARVAATGALGFVVAIAIADLHYPDTTEQFSAAWLGLTGSMWLVSLALAVWAEWLLRREFGSIERFVAYAGSLRSGELPASIEPEVWRGWLARSRKLNRQAPVAALLLVVFGVARALSHPSAAHLIIAALLGVCVVSVVVKWRIERRQIARLTTAVQHRAAASPNN